MHLKGGCNATICLSFQSPPTVLLAICKQIRNEPRSLAERAAIAYTPTAVVTANDDNEASPTGGVAAVLTALEYLAELFEDYRWDPYLLVRLSHESYSTILTVLVAPGIRSIYRPSTRGVHRLEEYAQIETTIESASVLADFAAISMTYYRRYGILPIVLVMLPEAEFDIHSEHLDAELDSYDLHGRIEAEIQLSSEEVRMWV